MPGAVPVDRTAAGPDHPGLIPASLLELDRRDDEPWRHIRRSGRDWTVDVTCVVLSAVVGAAFLAATATDQPAPSPVVLVVDGVFGVISCAALWLRRRFPVGVAVLTALLSIFSVATAVAATIAMFTVAVHRRMQTALAIGLLNVVTAGLFFVVRPQNVRINGEPVAWWILTVTTTAMLAAVVAWGMLVRARRQLVVSLHERAERAEAEQRLLADQARQAERARIAREMHDVVAHRVSLITLHAGALQLRSDLPPAEIERTAALIHTAAHQALEELRDVIGVLHEDGSSEVAPSAPQPTVTDIARLVEDSRRAGACIELSHGCRRPRQRTRRTRPRRLPDRAGSPHQHQQTRPRHGDRGDRQRRRRTRPARRRPQPAAPRPQPADLRCPDRGGGSSGSPNGPPCREEHCTTDPPPTATSSSPPTSHGLDERPARPRSRAPRRRRRPGARRTADDPFRRRHHRGRRRSRHRTRRPHRSCRRCNPTSC